MKTIVAVDQYIANSAEFAIPILEHLRNLVHRADARVEERMKWSMPFFEYKGTVCHSWWLYQIRWNHGKTCLFDIGFKEIR